jgi:hypothetical protein
VPRPGPPPHLHPTRRSEAPVSVDYDAVRRWIAFNGRSNITIVANLADTPVTLPYPGALLAGIHRRSTADAAAVQLAPWIAAITSTGR